LTSSSKIALCLIDQNIGILMQVFLYKKYGITSCRITCLMNPLIVIFTYESFDGMEIECKERHGSEGKAWKVKAWHGKTWYGKTRHGK
jgi:hypothetical protein